MNYSFYLRKSISALYKQIRFITFIFLINISFCFFYTPIRSRIETKKISDSYRITINELESEVSYLEKEKLEIEQEKEILTNEVNEMRQEARTINSDMETNLDTYIELRDKYSNTINYNNPNSDFGLNELVYLNDVCNEYNVPISIMLAIFEKESGFRSTAKNSSSTATGYGQLINTTAQSMYERFLKLGIYDISNHRTLACDKKLNILMATRLMKYNLDMYCTKWKAVERYYGSGDEAANYAYASDINSRMNKYGGSLNW